MARDGESAEEDKARMAAEQTSRNEMLKAEAEAREATQKGRIEASLEISRNASKRN